MKIRCLIFVLITFWIQLSYAETDCPPELVEQSKEQLQELQKSSKDRGFLWKVTRDGKISHLYGTIHAAKLEWIFPGPKLISALQQSKKLVLELNLQDSETMKVLEGLSSSKDAPTLPNELIEKINRYAISNCVNPKILQKLRPEFQLMTLSLMSMKREGIDPSLGIDGVLAGIASSLKMTVAGLEKPNEQADVLLSKPNELEQDIKEALEKLESGEDKQLIGKLTKAWAESDFKTLNSYTEWCNCTKTEKDRTNMKRLLDDRNFTMSTRFDGMHAKDGQLFLAVGALHMVGATGLPTLLTKLGYVVEQLQ
jgi:uncharacterized protein